MKAMTGASCPFQRSSPHGNASVNPFLRTSLRIATQPVHSAMDVAHAAPAAPPPITPTAIQSSATFTNAARQTHRRGDVVSFLATNTAYAAVVRYAAGIPTARIRVKFAAVAITSGGVLSHARSGSGKSTRTATRQSESARETASAP